MMMCLLQCASGYFRCSVYCSYNLNKKNSTATLPHTAMLYLAFCKSKKVAVFSKIYFVVNIFWHLTWNSQPKSWHQNSQQFKKHMPASDSARLSSFSCNPARNTAHKPINCSRLNLLDIRSLEGSKVHYYCSCIISIPSKPTKHIYLWHETNEWRTTSCPK